MSYAPSPHPQGDNVARVVCALIAVLAVLAAVVLLLVGNDPPARATVQPAGPGPVASSDGGSGGGQATAGVSPSYLVDHFPVPPGQTDVPTSESSDGTKTYDLDGGLTSVRSFVGSRLAALGFTWTPIANSSGYTGTISARTKVVGALALTTISATRTRATVRITA